MARHGRLLTDPQWAKLQPLLLEPHQRPRGARHRVDRSASSQAPDAGRPGPAALQARWTVERTFAWLGNFRRLVVRYDRSLTIYRGLSHIARFMIVLRRVLK
jgi:transposase